MKKQPQLIGYAAFWHNDKPWGFGASLYRDGWDTKFFDTFHHQAEQLGLNLHHDSTMTVEEARSQLKQFAKDYKADQTEPFYMNTKVALLMLIFGNVKFLILREAIPDNEFNGLQYVYENF